MCSNGEVIFTFHARREMAAEKILRLLVAQLLKDKAPAVGFDELAVLKGTTEAARPKRGHEPKLTFRRVRVQSKPAWAEPDAA